MSYIFRRQTNGTPSGHADGTIGKKIIFLRLIALLPIAYEIACLWLKVRSVAGRITLPFWTFPLLTVKPPVTYALFVCLAIHFGGRKSASAAMAGPTGNTWITCSQTGTPFISASIWRSVC